MRTEAEVDKIIEDMINRSKGNYITQGVAFNKSCPRQIELLKRSLMTSVSFSGLIKEVLAIRFDGGGFASTPTFVNSPPKSKDIGNFL